MSGGGESLLEIMKIQPVLNSQKLAKYSREAKMGRKIPGKKHHGVKDPEKQKRARLDKIKLKVGLNMDELISYTKKDQAQYMQNFALSGFAGGFSYLAFSLVFAIAWFPLCWFSTFICFSFTDFLFTNMSVLNFSPLLVFFYYWFSV